MITSLKSTMIAFGVAILVTFALSSCENSSNGSYHTSRSSGVGPKGNSMPMTHEHVSGSPSSENGMHSMGNGPTKGGPLMSNADMPRRN